MDANARPRNDDSARIAPLASLPLFFDLKAKTVLVAGGSAGAAWKAELLAACGATVHLYAPVSELSAETRDLLRNEARILHRDTSWREADFEGHALAIGDCHSDDAARAFHDRAVACGIPVNVIDRPQFCQFKFGSIVNRSPVVVGISTDGAAPILGQAIRRRIETLLPPVLADWAALAARLREAVSTRLPMGAQRRAFWESFVDRAMTTVKAPTSQTADELGETIADFSTSAVARTGRVTLVGAGPGDAELLTLKAVRALQAADVILFDDLVSSDVLELARREARRMLVGKRGGRESCRQEDINDMMVAFARAGKHVVRLKSGDPMIFGRAGEEIARLRDEGIAVDVVPGITSASAMASRLGVSLTHRDCAQSVRFVTGHSRQGELPDTIDWPAIARPNETTVFYMGGRTVGAIRAKLLAAGASAATPVVIVSAISRPEETHWIGTLDRLEAAMHTIGVSEPVLIGLGAVFAAAGREMVTTMEAAHAASSARARAAG